jgi:hypothetical protein
MRKRLPPDNRLDWRDPNMPCLRIAKPENDPNAPWGVYPFPPDTIHEYHKRAMVSPRIEPTWKYDPSYFWNKKK